MGVNYHLCIFRYVVGPTPSLLGCSSKTFRREWYDTVGRTIDDKWVASVAAALGPVTSDPSVDECEDDSATDSDAELPFKQSWNPQDSDEPAARSDHSSSTLPREPTCKRARQCENLIPSTVSHLALHLLNYVHLFTLSGSSYRVHQPQMYEHSPRNHRRARG